MTPPSSRRLPRSERRDQLIETALAIVREQGTDALTLGYLAERAGVSKPVAYEHFGTRSGLLMELFKAIDDRQVGVFLEALDRAPRRLEDAARVMGEAYMACHAAMGPEGHAISAALKGAGEMESFQQELLDGYVDLYCDALAAYVKAPRSELRLRCVAIVGAAESISREMMRGRVGEREAAEAVAALIVSSLAAVRRPTA